MVYYAVFSSNMQKLKRNPKICRYMQTHYGYRLKEI